MKKIIFINQESTNQDLLSILPIIRKYMVQEAYYVAIQVIVSSCRLMSQYITVSSFFGYVNHKKKEEYALADIVDFAMKSEYENIICVCHYTNEEMQTFLEKNFEGFKKILIGNMYFFSISK
jgi:hypothetical protein